MFTGFNQMFGAATEGRKTTEKRLVLDISTTRITYRRFEICGLGLIRGYQNAADLLSEIRGKGMLGCRMEPRMDDTQIVQWIDRLSIRASTIATEEVM